MDEDIGKNFKIMRNKREDRSLYLGYSNHLKRHWKPGLIRPPVKSLKKLSNY